MLALVRDLRESRTDSPASNGRAAVYAAKPATATNASKKLLTLNTTSLPIDDLRELTSVTVANVTASDRKSCAF